jgi:hypothetical protein
MFFASELFLNIISAMENTFFVTTEQFFERAGDRSWGVYFADEWNKWGRWYYPVGDAMVRPASSRERFREAYQNCFELRDFVDGVVKSGFVLNIDDAVYSAAEVAEILNDLE